jgi:ATP-dependent helicase/nuclease subunit A
VTELQDALDRRRIATDTSASLFVEAGAGSGKTSSLLNRVLTLVVQDGVQIKNIAAVTFTEKAGAELRDRLRVRFELELQSSPDGTARQRLDQALDGLDVAPIGTLHSFAQRILMMFPIQAQLPPLIEILDEVASSVAFEARWSVMQRELLDDADMSDNLMLALATGVRLDQLRSLARAFGSDWDLIEERVLSTPAAPLHVPATAYLADEAMVLARYIDECTDPSDLFIDKLVRLREWAERLHSSTSDAERFAAVSDAAKLNFAHGRAGNWVDLPGLRSNCKELQTRVAAVTAEFAETALRPVAHWIAQRVHDSAAGRRSEGRLEFHDLLVIARDLVRRDAEVRGLLQAEFPRLLLDEFQDTDPIQIELATRIAGGAEATASDWRDIVVPNGSLFVVGDPKQSIYRFRRASIETYMTAQEHIGEAVALTSNFRTVAPILHWVNEVFAQVIQKVDKAQPEYSALVPERPAGGAGVAVGVLGAEEHTDKPNAAELREREARDVAAAISHAIAQWWTVEDRGSWRPIRARDIAVLVPARTSLPFIEEAFTQIGLPYRAESSSLVYQSPEVRDIMALARAIADPSDSFACVTALRSALFGCGDDDLWTFKRDGGSFALFAPVPEGLSAHPVAEAMRAMVDLLNRSQWRAPSEVLSAIVTERRVLEVAELAYGERARDIWRRVRFIIDQARAWSEVQSGGLRDYLVWAARQADDASRVAESVLPESDLDVVRIMTIHAAKGLEFPMVVLTGMSSQPRRSSGVRLLWTAEGYEVSLTKRLQTNDFATAQPLDEQMGEFERRRLLYVAATRARDHLVVSLHRAGNTRSNARILAEARAADLAGAVALNPHAEPIGSLPPVLVPAVEKLADWALRVRGSRERSRVIPVRSASGLEGTEPAVVLAITEEPDEELAGSSKGARDLNAPFWLKGRYGNLIGRAVHGVLQSIDLKTGSGVNGLVDAQSAAEGVSEHAAIVAKFVKSALAAPLVREAASLQHWKESFVGTMDTDGLVLEGFVDLIFRRSDGTLVIVDYKTDAVPDGALSTRTSHYAPQINAYRRALQAATGAPVVAHLSFLAGDGSDAREVLVADPDSRATAN